MSIGVGGCDDNGTGRGCWGDDGCHLGDGGYARAQGWGGGHQGVHKEVQGQGCRIVLGAWQQKICAWQKIAKNA